jgi:hypothetical protein
MWVYQSKSKCYQEICLYGILLLDLREGSAKNESEISHTVAFGATLIPLILMDLDPRAFDGG